MRHRHAGPGSTIVCTPAERKLRRQAQRLQEQRWASLAGPVTITRPARIQSRTDLRRAA